jgi:hypothetical protein
MEIEDRTRLFDDLPNGSDGIKDKRHTERTDRSPAASYTSNKDYFRNFLWPGFGDFDLSMGLTGRNSPYYESSWSSAVDLYPLGMHDAQGQLRRYAVSILRYK